MADLVSLLLNFPPPDNLPTSAKSWDQAARTLATKLESWDSTKWDRANKKQDLFEMLDPARNSLAYAFALRYQHTVCFQNVTVNISLAERWLNLALIFCVSFDPIQMRYGGAAFREVLQWTFDAISKSDTIDFYPVVTAMLRLDPSGGTFTSTHLALLRRCLSTGNPSQALPLLDRDIYAFPQKATKHQSEECLCEVQDLSNVYITADSGFSLPLKPEYVLEYYLLGAFVYIGRRQYPRARLFLEHVILAPSPSHAHSALQVEAYQKWVLVGLLANGSRYPLPRTHDQQVMKSLRAASKAYDSLAENFEKRDSVKFSAEMETGSYIWGEDGNLGILHEVSRALLRFRVADLSKTFVALPVGDVAARIDLSPDESLGLLTQMISEGHINASITPAAANGGSAGEAVLRFNLKSPTTSTAVQTPGEDLGILSKRIEGLASYVRDADRRLQLTKEYVEFQRRQKRAAAGVEGDLADQMDLSWEAPIPSMAHEDGDEDLMAS